MAVALKKPIGVYFIAILFLIAPLGNLLISFAGSGVQNWHEASVVTAFLSTVPFYDWLWLGLIFLTGLLLFKPHKTSWTLALISLFVVLVINSYRLFSVDQNSIDPAFLKIFSIVSVLVTLGVLVIAFYFRFPYLDRRAGFLVNLTRYEVEVPLKMKSPQSFSAMTESLSLSGLRAKISAQDGESLNKDQVVEFEFTQNSFGPVQAQVISVDQENGETKLRLKFLEQKNLNKNLRNLIDSFT